MRAHAARRPLLAAHLVLLLAAAAAASDRGFLVTAPKRLLAGSTERVCLAFFNVSGPAHVQLALLRADSDERLASATHRVQAEEAGCVPLSLPPTAAAAAPGEAPDVDVGGDALPARARLLVQARFDHAYDYVVSAVREVRVQPRPLLLFVQTERAAYRPGQRVRARILALQHDFTPAPDDAVAAAWLLSPAGVRLAHWTRPAARQGLAEVDFQLAPDPPLGTWSLRVRLSGDGSEHAAPFDVREYVLPRFTVSVSGPRYVLADAPHAAWRVCARYAHGEAVRGHASVRVEARVAAWRAAFAAATPDAAQPPRVLVLEQELHGCVTVNASERRLLLRHWDAAPAAIAVHAEVTEAGTGARENASIEVPVEHQALRLGFLPGSPRHFKPGLPYAGSLRALRPDGTPAARVALQLCLKARRRREWTRSLVQCRNFSADADGELHFRLAPQPRYVQLLSLVATAVDFPTKYYAPGTRWRVLMDQPSTFFDVHAWFSPSGHFLEVVDEQPEGPRCGAPHDFTVYYTGDAPAHLRYLVTARGDIVQAGVAVTRPAPERASAPHPFTLGEVEGAAEGAAGAGVPAPRAVVFSVKVSPRMTPFATLLVYRAGLPGGEVAAAAVAIRAPRCFANAVRASFLRTRQAPGGEATLRVRAAPQSLCALAATDIATAALGASSLLGEERAFAALAPFHIEPFHMPKQADDVDYCSRRAANLSAAPALPTAAAADAAEATAVEAEAEAAAAAASASDSEPAFWDLRRRRRSLDAAYNDGAPTSKFVDAIQAFDDAGILVLTDLVLETRPCQWPKSVSGYGDVGGLFRVKATIARGLGTDGPLGPPQQHRQSPAAAAAAAAAGFPAARPPMPSDGTLRTHFPETWLWELLPMGNATTRDVRRRLPDSVTQWEASVWCVAPRVGLGVAPATRLAAFQPFFLDVALPYAVKRGEVLALKAVLFNYLPHSLPVRLSLTLAEGLEVVAAEGDAGATAAEGVEAAAEGALQGTGCVAANDSLVHVFRVRAARVGVLNVTVTAEVEPLLPDKCGPDYVLAQRDAVVKPLRVVAEGFPVHRSYSAYICPSNFSTDSSVSWRLLLPADAVEDSERAEVNIVGDLLGPTLQNLEHLVRLPMGCGEQNMILFVPNLHVIEYLNATGRLAVSIHTEALKNLRKGYQRQLNYRHADGSYSAFGEQDGEGSLWLTAFVVRALARARAHIFVDEKDLEASARWVLRQQLENGCFPPVGQVFHKDIRGGLSDEAPSAALTAFVLASLLESGLPLPPSVTENALFCLQADGGAGGGLGEGGGGAYALALKAYALALLAERSPAAASFAADALRRLLGAASRAEGLLWWEGSSGGANRALDVEATSYAILALLRAGGDGDASGRFLQALDAVRWVATNANAQGGFVSTQDTVVALEALGAYARRVPGVRTALALLVTAGGVQEQLHVRHEERLLLRTLRLPRLPTRLEVQAEGDGCALVQASLRYNVRTPSGSDAFELDVQTGPVASVDACTVQRVEACVRYKIPAHASNMAVIEVNMVSGYKPDRSSLHHLAVTQGPAGFKRWEEEEDKVNFYFEELTNKRVCVSFLIVQETEVENPSYAVVTVYDYYRQELSLSQKYSTDAGCRNERLPDPQPQIADATLSDSFFETENETVRSSLPAETNSNTSIYANDSGIPDNLNPQFVNVDFDLETPTGIEGPIPSYALPQSDYAGPNERDSLNFCPVCTLDEPENLSDLYCNAATVYKMALKKENARILLDLSPGQPPKRMRKNVILEMNEFCHCEPLVKVADVQHFVLISKVYPRISRTETDVIDRLILDERINIFLIPVQPGQPEVIKQIRQTCV